MAEQAYAYVTLIPVAKGFQAGIAKELAGIPELGAQKGLSAGETFKKGFKDAMSQGPSLGSVIGGALTTAVVAGGVAISKALTAASGFYAEFEGVNQIFLDGADAVQTFADTAATSIGLSETEALRAAKAFGGFATAAGLSGQAAADFSIDLLQAAGDLASFNDVPVEQALQALQSGLAGQSEPLRNFQIFIDDTTLKAYAMEQGLGDVYDSMTQNEKTILRQGAIMEQLGVRQGDFVNYADTFGNAIKTIQATFADLGTEIGLALMPAFEELVVTFRDGLAQIKDPTTDLGEAWNELIGTFEAFGETFAMVFGRIDAAKVLENILDVVQMLVNGFSQIIYIGGDVADTLSKIFSGDFEGAYKNASTFFTRYNRFVDGLYKSADDAAARAIGNRLADNQKQLADAMKGVKVPAPTFTFTGGAAGGTAKSQREQLRKLIRDTRASFKEARQEYAKEVADLNKDFEAAQTKIGEAYNEAVAQANETFAMRSADIAKQFDKAVNAATKRRDESLASALTEHNKRLSQIQKDFAQRQADIIQQSMDRLRDAYRNAVAINVASIFDSDELAGSIDGTVEVLREKLLASQQLIDNAAKLNALGFSQTFIEQVVGAGTELGNELANSILGATPDTIAELKSLYGQLEDQSETAMDSLAQAIYDEAGLATSELKALYATAEAELVIALEEQNQAYQETIAEINAQFNQSIVDAQIARDEALVEAQAALDRAIQEAKDRRDKALKEAEEALQEALLKAAENFDKDLANIQKQFNTKIAEMKGAAKALASQISALQSQIASAQAAAAAIKVPQIPAQVTPKVKLAEGGLVTGPTNALIGEAGPEVVIPLDRFESMMNMTSSSASINYYAAPNQSIDSERDLFQAMRRAKVVVGW